MRARHPVFDVDLYTDAAILDPYPLYRAIRDLGPAVWLGAHDAWAIGRFTDVRAALRDDGALVSGHGVALNPLVNGEGGGRVTLNSDGDLHRRLRAVLMKPMMPSALRDVRDQVQALADDLVDGLLARDHFDGPSDFAQHLPVAVISHLVGLPEEGRHRMLAWAAATFDALGPLNARAEAAFPLLFEMIEYARGIERERLSPGGWAARVFEAVDDGRLESDDARGLLIDYIAPSLDTTILATSQLLFQLGRHPDQWALVRADPDLIPRAVDEALRLGTPVRAFTRLAVADYECAGTTIPAGDRVLVLYASANRDERRFADPDRFDVMRDAKDHVAFGHGVHRCAGGYVAELEMQALLRAMVARVERIEVGEPELALNNVLGGFRSFRASFR